MTHMNDYLPERLATNPLQAMESDSDIEAIADAVISASVLRDECDGDAAFKKSARQLLYACLGYLRGASLRTGFSHHRPRGPVLRDRVGLQARHQRGRHHHELGADGT